ncbi:MAG: hypothetical protein GY731_01865 [Gammaproteobacteria bacterium]|nr:hypothetical protein [Gammaproteobacteria bacterium]
MRRIRRQFKLPPGLGTFSGRGYVPISLVACCGLLLIWLEYSEVSEWERQRVRDLFREDARERVLVVQRELDHTLGVVEDIGSFFDASPKVGRREFRKFVGPTLQRLSGIRSLEWVPKVTDAERRAFVTDARESFDRFRIMEPGKGGGRITAGQRPEYFPILYIQPYQRNKELLGFDLASDPEELGRLNTVRDVGRMRVSTRPIPVVHSMLGSGFAVHLPIYHREKPIKTLAERRRHLRGFAVGMFRLDELVDRSLETLAPAGIDLHFFTGSVDVDKRHIYTHKSRLRDTVLNELGDGKSAIEDITLVIEMAGEKWDVVCRSMPGRYEPDPWNGWAILVGGLAFTLLLTVYLATLLERESKVKSLVFHRTRQLVLAKRQLQALNEGLEQRVVERSAESEKRAAELEQFAYVISHDLKAPLRGISNLVSWLEEDLGDRLTTDTREQMDLIHDRLKWMHALIEGLLEYSRVGRVEGTLENVDTCELLTEVIDSLSPPAGMVIKPWTGMPTLSTDRIRLSQVFANLIGNAIKHHDRQDGQIRIGVSDGEGFYEFSVTDDGPGIAMQHQQKIFMMFQTLKPKDQGINTGVGLALVKKIVEERGGAVILESSLGYGSTFRFTWPKKGGEE